MNNKRKISLIRNNVNVTEVEVSSLQELGEIITENCWSPYRFKESYRNSANFIDGDFFALDIDSDLTIEEAKERLIKMGLDALLSTSRSHQKEKGGVVADRFRIIFPLQSATTSPFSCFHYLAQTFSEADPSCKDKARYFYPSTTYWIQETGKQLFIQEGQASLHHLTPSSSFLHNSPSKYITACLSPFSHYESPKFPLSKKTMEFIKGGAERGTRHNKLLDAIHDAIQQGWPREEFISLFQTQGKDEWMREPKEVAFINEIYDNFQPLFPPRVGPPEKPAPAEIEPLIMTTLKKAGIQVNYNKTLRFKDDPKTFYNMYDFEQLLRVHYRNMNLRISNDEIHDIIERWVNVKRNEYLERIKEAIKFDGNAQGKIELKKFLAVLNKKHTPLDVAIWTHMVWQIKRKMWGFKPSYHMMLVIEGPQGSGKSISLSDYFLKPLDLLAYNSADAAILSDAREAQQLANHFALVFDELGGFDKHSMEHIKRTITQDVIKPRILGTNAHVELPMRATFFGTSNRPLNDMIKDSTGMRRFGVFKTESRELTRERWKQLADIEYYSIWKGVDEQQEQPSIIIFLEELNQTQEEFRHLQPVEAFILESGLVEILPDGASLTEWMKATELLDLFNEWYRQTYNPTSFGRELRTIPTVKKIKNSEGIFYNLRKINRIEAGLIAL